MVKCVICDSDYKNLKGLSVHINRNKEHSNLTVQEYYDEYLKDSAEDACEREVCDNKTNYEQISTGYKDYCSESCASLDRDQEVYDKISNSLEGRELKQSTIDKLGHPGESNPNYSGGKDKHECENCDEVFYDWIDRVYCSYDCKYEAMSDEFSGEDNPFYGEKHTQETLDKLRGSNSNYDLEEYEGYRNLVDYHTDYNSVRGKSDSCTYCGAGFDDEDVKRNVDHRVSAFHGFKLGLSPETVSKNANLTEVCESCNSAKREDYDKSYVLNYILFNEDYDGSPENIVALMERIEKSNHYVSDRVFDKLMDGAQKIAKDILNEFRSVA